METKRGEEITPGRAETRTWTLQLWSPRLNHCALLLSSWAHRNFRFGRQHQHLQDQTHILLMVHMRHRLIPNYIYSPQWWKALRLLLSDHRGLECQPSPERYAASSLSLGLSEQQCFSGCSLWEPGKGVHHCKTVVRLREAEHKHPTRASQSVC